MMLPGIGRERLDIPPLDFGIECIERERRFAGAGDTRDHDKLVKRDPGVDIFQVVLACTFDDDVFHGYVLRESAPAYKAVQFGA